MLADRHVSVVTQYLDGNTFPSLACRRRTRYRRGREMWIPILQAKKVYLDDEPQGVAQAAAAQEQCAGEHVTVTAATRRRRTGGAGGFQQVRRPQVQEVAFEQADDHRAAHARQGAQDLEPARPLPQRHLLGSE